MGTTGTIGAGAIVAGKAESATDIVSLEEQ
jgi:hypothetical protein